LAKAAKPPLSPTERALRDAAAWHAGWLAVMAAGAVAAAVFPPSDGSPMVTALGLAALPGLAGLLLPRFGDKIEASLLILWSVCAAAAVMLGGGLTGPFAIWSVTPLAAGIVMGGGRRLPGAATLSAAIAAAAVLAQMSGFAPVGEPHPAYSLFAVVSLGLALAAALLVMRRRDAALSLDADDGKIADLLYDHGLMLMFMDAQGALRRRVGALPDALAGTDARAGLVQLATDPLEAIEAISAAFRQGHAEFGFAPAGAPDRWIVATLTRRRSGLTAVLRDATLERAREAGLEQAAADAEALNAGKSRFLANMSHELRTPLNAIIGFSDIMRSRMFGPISDRYAEYAGLVHESGGHLLDLINDVLDMSKIEAQRFELSREEFDARDAISAALRLTRVQADTAGVNLRGTLPATPLEVDADRRAIKQIVLNLVSNALKFTNKGGQVIVSARAQGADLEIIVADTGVGIATEDLARLGRPFEQAGGSEQKALGTGLGLSLVRAFAELHGGSMTIESALGEGTAVTVRMPVMLDVRAPAPSTPTSASAEPAAMPQAAAALGSNVVAFKPQR